MLKRLISRWPLVGALFFFAYSAYLLWAVLNSQSLIQSASENRILAENQRRAMTIEAFFADRQNEVAEIAERSEIESYFLNKDLGMSERYGLFANLAAIDDYFIRKRNKIGIGSYKSISLYDAQDTPLSFDAPAAPVLPLDRETRQRPAIHLLGTNGEFAISSPVILKNEYRGIVIATGNLERLSSTLLGERHESSLHELLINQSGQIVQWRHNNSLAVPDAVLGFLQGRPAGALVGIPKDLMTEAEDWLAIRNPIPGTPLQFVTLIQQSTLYGMTSTPAFWFFLGVIPVALLIFSLMFERSRQRSLALQVSVDRLTEEIEQRKLLESRLLEKNEALKELSVKYQETATAAEMASRAKSEFLATMSHEIRTPMNAILGMAQILDSRELGPAEQAESTHILLESSRKLLGLLNEILDLSRIEAGKMTLHPVPFNPASLLQHTLAMFRGSAEEKHLELGFSSDLPPNQLYLADESRLRQMLANLISNAIKFTERGGIHVTLKPLDTLTSGTSGTCRLVEFSVTDTGIGIPEEKRALLFQSFSQVDSSSTRRFGGSGLGLSIVMKLARQMGGTAGCESIPGRGSRFWFQICIPEAVSPQMGAPTSPSVAWRLRPGTRLLVVDDDPVNRRVLGMLLAKLGPEIEYATNGQEAVDLFSSCTAFALVMMDMQMPVMDGVEATTRIRQIELDEARTSVPIIAITGNAFEDDRRRCEEVGMDDFVAKPVQMQELKRVLAEHLPSAIEPVVQTEATAQS